MKHHGCGFAVVAALLCVLTNAPDARADNHIVTENLKAGTGSWRLTRPANDAISQAKGYADRLSVTPGQTIRFHIAVNPSQQYSLRIYRLGYYQGLGGRQVWARTNITGRIKGRCPMNATTGQSTCAWSSDVSLQIPAGWVTGIYVAKITNSQGFDNHIPFLVRHAGSTPDLIYQQPVTTYHAYNNYPNDGTGKSTYDSNSSGANTVVGRKRAVRVSFDRPLADTGSTLLFRLEHELIMFLEERGYDIGYVTDIDTHANPGLLNGIKGFISAGHDEYWTSEMRDAVDAARDRGINLAFFGANAAFWQIRLKPDAEGRSNRVMEVYKNYNIDPEPDPRLKTVTFRAIGRAEQQLIGVQYIDYAVPGSKLPLVTRNTGHWIYDGTGVTDGTSVPGIIGGEMDVLFPQYPQPVSTEYTVLGSSPIQGAEVGLVNAQTVIYRAPSGAWVFASGTLLWQNGLNDPNFRSPVIRQMTTNLLNRFVDLQPGTTPALEMSAQNISEDGGDLIVNFSLSNPSTNTVTFAAATFPGTAQPGTDFYGRYRQFDLAPGVTNISWAIPIVNDTVPEGTEQLTIRVVSVQGARAATTRITPSILDDDFSSTPSLSMGDVTVNEIDGTAAISINLSSPTNQIVRVNFSTTTGGTATPGQDFYGSAGTIQINPGQISGGRTITIINDTDAESPETLRLQIMNPQNAIVANRYATLTIISDE